MSEIKIGDSISLLPEHALMPRELTAENGAKRLLMGEFLEIIEAACGECKGLGFYEAGDSVEDCNVCAGSGYHNVEVPVHWSTIKAIYAKCVELYNPTIKMFYEKESWGMAKKESEL